MSGRAERVGIEGLEGASGRPVVLQLTVLGNA